MAIHKIVINGQSYDGPEAMPPDVRRMYEEAMRAVGPPSPSREDSNTTQVFTGHAGDLGASVVVNRVVTVNNRTYAGADELPPEVRKVYEDALKGETSQVGSTRPRTSLHLSVNLTGPRVRSVDDPGTGPAPPPVPFDSSTTESKLRSIPVTLAIIVVIGLIIWARLGR